VSNLTLGDQNSSGAVQTGLDIRQMRQGNLPQIANEFHPCPYILRLVPEISGSPSREFWDVREIVTFYQVCLGCLVDLVDLVDLVCLVCLVRK